MPTAPPSRCTHPGCGNDAVHLSRCAEHKRSPWANAPAPQRRVYDSRWEKVRAAVLRDEPDCRVCGVPAEDVDHILGVADGGAWYERDNLQPLCHPCHDAKSRRENARRARERAERRRAERTQTIPF